MGAANIEVLESAVRIRDLEVARKDVADFLRGIPEEEREVTVVRAIEVGAFCLERARTAQDLEYVKRQVEGLVHQVGDQVKQIPGDVEKALAEKIGIGEGQVLAPIQVLIDTMTTGLVEKLGDVRKLLDQEIDPTRETTTLAKALAAVRNMVDPQHQGSIQQTLATELAKLTTTDGTLAEVVKKVVAESVKPLKDEVDGLAKEIRGQEAAQEALEQTTEKGLTFEEQVLEQVRDWSRFLGGEVHHVGTDNRPGDVVVEIKMLQGAPIKIAVEARDRQTPLGRKAITDDISNAMNEREAGGGLYVSKTLGGFGKEIGEWAEGDTERGHFVACTREHLRTALRFLIMHRELQLLKASRPEVDAAAIEGQLERIRTALARLKTVNSKLTVIRGGADGIEDEARLLREEISSALDVIEGVLRRSAGQADVAGKA